MRIDFWRRGVCTQYSNERVLWIKLIVTLFKILQSRLFWAQFEELRSPFYPKNELGPPYDFLISKYCI
jgi:hypothetical protein